MQNRVWFKNNPWPNGHLLKNAFWSAWLDNDGIRMGISIETEKYYAETDPPDKEDASDWEAPSVWSNYHSCSMNCKNGFLVGSSSKKFDPGASLLEFKANPLPGDENFDMEEDGLEIYLLGHDTAADCSLTIKSTAHTALFDIIWKGKIALTYAGCSEFDYDFEAHLFGIEFPRIQCGDLDIADARDVFAKSITNPELFEYHETNEQYHNRFFRLKSASQV